MNETTGETRWTSPDSEDDGEGGESAESTDADFDDLPPESLSRARAIADFTKETDDQLSFQNGDDLIVQVCFGI